MTITIKYINLIKTMVKQKQIGVYLDDETRTLLDGYATSNSLSRSSALRLLIHQFVKKEPK